ncbi:MAG: hypothetical protein WBW69_15055 [Candidatus Korobacteraceae bacterium]
MRRLCIVFLALLCWVGCAPRQYSADNSQQTPERKAAVEANVRSYMAEVARDVSANGPTAWQKHFVDDPAFFMAAEGQLFFPNGQPMGQWVQGITHFIKTVNLQWGDALRIDPLTPTLAMVGAPYVEVRTDPQGQQTSERGYFTGLAEYRNGQWQFRDAHWSAVPAPSGKNPQ